MTVAVEAKVNGANQIFRINPITMDVKGFEPESGAMLFDMTMLEFTQQAAADFQGLKAYPYTEDITFDSVAYFDSATGNIVKSNPDGTDALVFNVSAGEVSHVNLTDNSELSSPRAYDFGEIFEVMAYFYGGIVVDESSSMVTVPIDNFKLHLDTVSLSARVEDPWGYTILEVDGEDIIWGLADLQESLGEVWISESATASADTEAMTLTVRDESNDVEIVFNSPAAGEKTTTQISDTTVTAISAIDWQDMIPIIGAYA